MPATVLEDNKGLTLIEVMIASLIVLILFLALMQSVLLSINMNMKNQLRDEAVNIAEDRMKELRSESFDPIPPATTNDLTEGTFTEPLVNRNFRNFTLPGGFTIRRTIDDLGADIKSITVRVSYMDIKDNRCSVTASIECTNPDDSECPVGETCGVTQTINSILRNND